MSLFWPVRDIMTKNVLLDRGRSAAEVIQLTLDCWERYDEFDYIAIEDWGT